MLGETIQTLRKAKGFTQEELAVRLNVVRQTVSKWEKGLSVPDAEMLTRLAETLEVPVAQLLGAPAEEKTDSGVAEQLARINEQLAVKNRRNRRVWRAVVAILIALALMIGATMVLSYVNPGTNPAEGTVRAEKTIIEE